MKKQLLASLLIGFALVGFGGVAHAGPIYVAPTVQTATATTSVKYMTPGTATTTLTYDSYAPATNTSDLAANSVGLFLQFAGSSTASVLHLSEEFSNDGIDWYGNYSLNQIGTTTNPATIGAANSYNFNFASTTRDGIAQTNANSATSTAFIQLLSPTRFLRLVTTLTGTNAAIWEQLIPIKERS